MPFLTEHAMSFLFRFFRSSGFVLLVCVAGLLNTISVAAQNAAPVMLANVYHPGIDLSAYWVSEKYDGIRAYWDGRRLLTRGGEVIHAPEWVIARWPETPLGGELWAGRGGFAEAVSTGRTQIPDDRAWRRLRFMVFDLPAHGGTFDQRLPALRETIDSINAAWVQVVPQERIATHALLRQRLQEVDQAGGEGLMLHRGDSLYRAGRTDDLLKLKLHDDA